jgi:tetratricopeptide (TPR) repeat protein
MDNGIEGAYHNLGDLYSNQGKLVEAEQMYQLALQGYEKAWGLEHTSTLATVHNLGLLYADQGKLVEAELMYQCALQGYEKAWGPEHTLTLDTVNSLGSFTPTKASWSRPSRCTSVLCKATRRHGVRSTRRRLLQLTTWGTSTETKASWSRPSRCTSGLCKATRRSLV